MTEPEPTTQEPTSDVSPDEPAPQVSPVDSLAAELKQGTIREFTASDGYTFRFRHYASSLKIPRGYVVALHGIQSHSGWYGYSSRRLSQAGFDVRFPDRRGSGLNETDRGHAPHEERLINDVAHFLADVRHERNRTAPTQPVILMGVSWGGKLAAMVAALRPELVDVLALLYPGICPRIRPTVIQRGLLRLAELAGVDRKTAPIPLSDPALFTSDPDWQQFLRDDERTLHEATTGFFIANRNLDRAVHNYAEWIHCPLLLMLAGQDRIINNQETKQFYERLGSTTRQLLEYPEAAHTLEFEPNREEIVSDLINWLDDQCGARLSSHT
ncbi:MAG: alpha/beta hydrolase [Planctomycetaceae bacterium]